MTSAPTLRRTLSFLAQRKRSLAFAAAVIAATPAMAERRIALVIGEEAYAEAPLPTAANDAGLIAESLRAAGFEVTGVRDADQTTLRQALRDFAALANEAGADSIAFVYYNGRALQLDGENYLAPVDARIRRVVDVPIEGLRLSDFSRSLGSAPAKGRFLVIDGARANPFPKEGEALAGGLALIDPDAGSLVAFNTAPGAVAPPEPGPYGVYATALAAMLREGGLTPDAMFQRVRLRVAEETKGAATPWHASAIKVEFSLLERAPDAPAPPPLPAQAAAEGGAASGSPAQDFAVALQRDTISGYQGFIEAHPRDPLSRRARAMLAARREATFWRRTVGADSANAYWTYLRRYPRGPHAEDARRRLARLSAPVAPPASYEVIEYEDLPPPPPEEVVYVEERPAVDFVEIDAPPPHAFMAYEPDYWAPPPPPPPPPGPGMLIAPALAGLAAGVILPKLIKPAPPVVNFAPQRPPGGGLPGGPRPGVGFPGGPRPGGVVAPGAGAPPVGLPPGVPGGARPSGVGANPFPTPPLGAASPLPGGRPPPFPGGAAQPGLPPGGMAPGGRPPGAPGGVVPPGGTAPVGMGGMAPGGRPPGAPGGVAPPGGAAPVGMGGMAPGGRPPGAPGGVVPPGGTAPGAPGGTAPGGAAPVGMGGMAPGGRPPGAPGGVVPPGGMAPGGAAPVGMGGMAPGGRPPGAPGGVIPAPPPVAQPPRPAPAPVPPRPAPPVVAPAAPAPLVSQPPRPAPPPVMRPPPPPRPAPPPVMRPPPPPRPAPPPVMRPPPPPRPAPPPIMRPPPPPRPAPPPVMRPPPPPRPAPPPVMRPPPPPRPAPPPVMRPPPCGRPGLPPCR